MSNVVLSGFSLLMAIFTGAFLPHSPASAGAPKERIALMVTGSNCGQVQLTLEAALRKTDGVFAVDGNSVPGHLLIDVVVGKTSEHDLLTVVHTTIGTALSCRVEVMQSCITAPPPTRTGAPAK
ncbi:MAG: hypothetical protein KGJ48_11685 [Nitrospirota bacterium]|nr:hypothetical protein [Nitrospirota bacterium]